MTSNLKGFPILKPKDCPSALLPDGNLCRLCRCPSTSKIKKHKTWKYLILFLLPSQGWDSFWFYFLMLRIYQHFKILPLSFVYNQSVDPVFYKVSHTQHFVPNSGPLKFQIESHDSCYCFLPFSFFFQYILQHWVFPNYPSNQVSSVDCQYLKAWY